MSNRPLLEIRNLKSIQLLEFPIPKSGTWLLTGANGVGKSALLTCLYRINYKDAFRDHFPSSSISRRLDSFENAQVSYQVNTSRVAYRRNRHRWVPRPRSQASLLRIIGFNGVVHIGATADRITPKPEDFNPARSRSASQKIIDLANEVFNTSRFSNLRVVNVTRGVNEAFVIRKGQQSPYDYFGEKLLSVGELCVLKLLKRVLALPSRSLILIDELEIALHPTAQARLFTIISRLSSEGNHTAIFSTHSATLLKLAKQNQILWLKKDAEFHSIVIGPQKSVVLGAMAGSEERATDRIFVVEDASARDFVEAVFECAAVDLLPEKRPKFKVISAGSWRSAIDLFRALRAQNDTISRVSLLMDGDVEDTMQEQRKVNPNNEHVSFYFSEGESELVIPFTPECFLALMVGRNREAYLMYLREICSDFQINLPTQIDVPPTDGRSEREPCKTYYRALCRELADADISDCSSKVFSAAMHLAKNQYGNDWGRIRRRVR